MSKDKKTPFQIYQIYVALKSHFNTTSYDFFKYNNKVRATKKAFEQRNDKAFFFRLAKHENPIEFMVSLLIEDDFWVGDMISNIRAEEIYKDWRRRTQSLTYMFKNELRELGNDIPSLFEAKRGSQPEIIKKYFNKKIHLETLVILVDALDMIPYWDKKLKDDLMWEELRNKIIKYMPFLKYDKTRFRKLVVDALKQ